MWKQAGDGAIRRAIGKREEAELVVPMGLGWGMRLGLGEGGDVAVERIGRLFDVEFLDFVLGIGRVGERRGGEANHACKWRGGGGSGEGEERERRRVTENGCCEEECASFRTGLLSRPNKHNYARILFPSSATGEKNQDKHIHKGAKGKSKLFAWQQRNEGE